MPLPKSTENHISTSLVVSIVNSPNLPARKGVHDSGPRDSGFSLNSHLFQRDSAWTASANNVEQGLIGYGGDYMTEDQEAEKVFNSLLPAIEEGRAKLAKNRGSRALSLTKHLISSPVRFVGSRPTALQSSPTILPMVLPNPAARGKRQPCSRGPSIRRPQAQTSI